MTEPIVTKLTVIIVLVIATVQKDIIAANVQKELAHIVILHIWKKRSGKTNERRTCIFLL